jgi:SAM-dependent methyltransferase
MIDSNPTIDYYNLNAEAFAASTAKVDMGQLYKRFLDFLPSGGKILDAGCGGGRDTRHFLSLGYEVEAFDASIELSRLSTEATGIKVSCCSFAEVSIEQEFFDGIWACASLLHLKPSDLPSIIEKLVNGLKKGGVLYASFKLVVDEKNSGGRYFCPMTPESLDDLLSGMPCLQIQQLWESNDARPDRTDRWINVLVVKSMSD